MTMISILNHFQDYQFTIYGSHNCKWTQTLE